MRNTPTPPPRKRVGGEITDGALEVSLAEENKKLKKDIEMLVSLSFGLKASNVHFSKVKLSMTWVDIFMPKQVIII